MSGDEQALAESVIELQKSIKRYNLQASVCGWLLIASLIAVPISVVIGSKALGIGAILWIMSTIIALGSITALQKCDGLASLLAEYRRLLEIKQSLDQAACSEGGASLAENPFDPIGLD